MGTDGDRTRSGLAFAFLALVERYRPPAILLENVPGLLSSHHGRDMAALVGLLGELGYGWAYRVLDAQHFGVPQRRRRVFILALDAQRGPGTECAAEVLSVGSRCDRHPPTGVEAGPGAADGTGAGAVLAREGKGVGHNYPDDHLIAGHGSAADGATSTRTLGAAMGHHGYTLGAQDADGGYLQVVGDSQSVARAIHASTGRRSGPAGDEVSNLVRSSPDPGGVRAPDGLAGRLDDRGGVVNALDQRRGGADDNEPQAGHLVAVGDERAGDDRRLRPPPGTGGLRRDPDPERLFSADDWLLPLGLDSHRYRCCGNGVVSSVAEWVGRRLLETL